MGSEKRAAFWSARLLVAVTTAACLSGLPRSGAGAAPAAPVKQKPLLRDFIGLNVHTVLFKPELYRPVCRLLRDYHGFDWDVGADTDYAPRFPLSRNGVNWDELYGGWQTAGYTVDVSVMFGATPPERWKDPAKDAAAYGTAFAKAFGPLAPRPVVESVEIGNEPGHYPDALYRTLFENMARGLRQGDPKLKIVTCATTPGPSERYAKSLTCVQGLEPLYDVINLHTYAFVEQYPTWRRSYPEDPSIRYLKAVRETLAWRDVHAPGKQVWITEFGWDASTKPAPPTGDFSKWVGSTETQQAQYVVRSFLVFSSMDVDRAYLYWFNDKDEAQLHGSSGITRNYVPKPAFHAMAHLYRTLGDYLFSRVVTDRPGELSVYEYVQASDSKSRIWAAWSPTGSVRTADAVLPEPHAKVLKAERMPLKDGPAEAVNWEVRKDGSLAVPVTESPVYLWLRSR